MIDTLWQMKQRNIIERELGFGRVDSSLYKRPVQSPQRFSRKEGKSKEI